MINGNLGAPGPDGTVQSPPCLDLGSLGEKAARLYRNGYPANPGIPEARAAVANMYNRFLTSRDLSDNAIDASNVLIATGGATDATQIAVDHIKSRWQSGESPTALLVTPVYHLYIGQLRESGFQTGFVDGVDSYDQDTNGLLPRSDEEILADTAAAITPAVAVLFVNSPRNPDGRVYGRAFLEGVLALLDQHPHLRVVSDTIYRDVAPPEDQVLTLFALAPARLRARIYETDGTSKSVAKTMDRAAWLISAAANIEEIATVSHLKRGRPALPQMLQLVSMDEYLAVNAPDYAAKNSAMYLQKLAYVAAAAAQVSGLHCSPHRGAYYGYLDLRAVDFGAPMSALEKENAVVDALIAKGVAVSPGINFRHVGAIRFNASFNNQTLAKLMAMIVETFAELGAPVTRREIPLPSVDTPEYHFQDYPVGSLTTHRR